MKQLDYPYSSRYLLGKRPGEKLLQGPESENKKNVEVS